MGQYKSQHTGPQIDAGINAALNPDVAVTPDSDALVTSGAVADALDNIDPTITSDTDTTLNGILVGNGSKVGTKSLDTSSLTNDADHVPVSSVVKSALTQVETDLASIHATGTTNTTGATIASGTYFYLNGALVRAKADIAVNATYTSGTNYETVTAGGLNDLMSAFVPSTVQSFTSDGYTVQYAISGYVACITITRNEGISTTFDSNLTTLFPFKVKTVSTGFNIYSTSLNSAASIYPSNRVIHVRHNANSGWFLASMTVIINQT